MKNLLLALISIFPLLSNAQVKLPTSIIVQSSWVELTNNGGSFFPITIGVEKRYGEKNNIRISHLLTYRWAEDIGPFDWGGQGQSGLYTVEIGRDLISYQIHGAKLSISGSAGAGVLGQRFRYTYDFNGAPSNDHGSALGLFLKTDLALRFETPSHFAIQFAPITLRSGYFDEVSNMYSYSGFGVEATYFNTRLTFPIAGFKKDQTMRL